MIPVFYGLAILGVGWGLYLLQLSPAHGIQTIEVSWTPPDFHPHTWPDDGWRKALKLFMIGVVSGWG